ncbi:type VI protein secretion system component Hcp [Caldalkalibacillus uzonensis]|uniref:Type VI protein secretion system component Hcp n=1 Tax=Caldalkalibacillus uzonensis TaxID=353224 RepID=A0ABU0CTG2_9BACI|nr:type VI protein secretion system component Hcp [Caldalkalibacillus uzonensis]
MEKDNRSEALTVEQLDHGPLPFCASRDDMAPLFTAEAYVNEQIQTVRLEDLRGSWTVLFFYASDFTFV